mmetsp:Transcript_36123/g.57841  ORF Transcript_36123/g.57841 Transcript_36123/m.57841 type:complete len:348 (-) Transcript_36123:155-1198(-)
MTGWVLPDLKGTAGEIQALFTSNPLHGRGEEKDKYLTPGFYLRWTANPLEMILGLLKPLFEGAAELMNIFLHGAYDEMMKVFDDAEKDVDGISMDIQVYAGLKGSGIAVSVLLKPMLAVNLPGIRFEIIETKEEGGLSLALGLMGMWVEIDGFLQQADSDDVFSAEDPLDESACQRRSKFRISIFNEEFQCMTKPTHHVPDPFNSTRTVEQPNGFACVPIPETNRPTMAPTRHPTMPPTPMPKPKVAPGPGVKILWFIYICVSWLYAAIYGLMKWLNGGEAMTTVVECVQTTAEGVGLAMVAGGGPEDPLSDIVGGFVVEQGAYCVEIVTTSALPFVKNIFMLAFGG